MQTCSLCLVYAPKNCNPGKGRGVEKKDAKKSVAPFFRRKTHMKAQTIELPELTDDAVKHLHVGFVLRHGPFKYLWFSQVLSQLAGHVLNFSLVIILYERTHSNALVSILVALISIPPILFSSLAGVYADNFNRKYILFLSNISRCVIALAILFFNEYALVLLAIAFVISTISQFFGPAESSSIASLVHHKGYFSANSLFVFTTYTAFLIGYSLAGPALKFLGGNTTFLALTGMFGLAAVMNVVLPPIKKHLRFRRRRSIAERAFGNLRNEFREGLRFIRGNRFLLVVILLFSAVFSFERAIISLLPDLARNVFRYSIDELSYFIITPAGIGAFFGAVIANWLKSRIEKTTIVLWGMLIASVALMLFPLYRTVDLLAAGRFDLVAFVAMLAVLSGLGDVFIIIAGQTIIHEQTAEHTRGRVFGSLITLMNLVGLPLILLVGFLGNTMPVVNIIFSIGVLMTAMIALSTAQFRKLARTVG